MTSAANVEQDLVAKTAVRLLTTALAARVKMVVSVQAHLPNIRASVFLEPQAQIVEQKLITAPVSRVIMASVQA